MTLTVVLAAAAVATSIPVLVWAFAGNRSAAHGAVLSNLAGNRVTDLRQAVLARSASERAMKPFMQRLGGRARGFTPAGLVDSLERRIAVAGRPAAWPIERVLAGKIVLGLVAVSLGTLYFLANPSGKSLAMAIFVTALGYFTPDLLLYSRGQERQKSIIEQLPDTLDQMTIAMEAGVGFESAMARAARGGAGALAQELMRTLQELQVGVSRSQAFRNLADRTDVADMRHFCVAVIQAEAYGVPIAEVLRVQAGEHRMKRRQRAEEKAMKIPVKVIFPLILCILPTLFIILMGPAAIRIMKTFSGGG